VAKKYTDGKGRAEKSIYFGLPHNLINTWKYRSLSAHAVKLMIDLGSQYRGFNNGDLCLSWSVMEQYGWRSRSTLLKAKNELLTVALLLLLDKVVETERHCLLSPGKKLMSAKVN